ncbi:vitrin-like [Physella acuta]|uniref:vitrin-like n=1 Tax=Physella acuta TaxID=109671 RepID=UPI0027DB6D32|nr:vitrin-like [Physella acuta]
MLDIIFVIDASASICVHVWHKQLKFFSQLVRQFSLGQRSTRVGAMTYSVTASKVFDLDDHSNADDMEKALQKAKLGHGLSNSHMALERILKHDMFGTKAGGRADAQDYVVFLTDGHSTQHEKTREAVEKMKKAGTRLVFVGIGYDISYELLETLTHRPGDIILLNSVKDNAWFPQKFLASNLCTVSKKKKKS